MIKLPQKNRILTNRGWVTDDDLAIGDDVLNSKGQWNPIRRIVEVNSSGFLVRSKHSFPFQLTEFDEIKSDKIPRFRKQIYDKRDVRWWWTFGRALVGIMDQDTIRLTSENTMLYMSSLNKLSPQILCLDNTLVKALVSGMLCNPKELTMEQRLFLMCASDKLRPRQENLSGLQTKKITNPTKQIRLVVENSNGYFINGLYLESL